MQKFRNFKTFYCLGFFSKFFRIFPNFFICDFKFLQKKFKRVSKTFMVRVETFGRDPFEIRKHFLGDKGIQST